jgi:hypothetical protein
VEDKKRRHAGFITQCLVLTRRSFLNMYRDLGYYWLRLAIYVGLGFGLATIFYDLGSTYGSIQVSYFLSRTKIYIWIASRVQVSVRIVSKDRYKTIQINHNFTHLIKWIKLVNPNLLISCWVCVGFTGIVSIIVNPSVTC